MSDSMPERGPAAQEVGADCPPDVATAFRRVQDRRGAFAAWEASGTWPPPAGLLSACLDAAMARPGKPQPKWGRR